MASNVWLFRRHAHAHNLMASAVMPNTRKDDGIVANKATFAKRINAARDAVEGGNPTLRAAVEELWQFAHPNKIAEMQREDAKTLRIGRHGEVC